MRKGFPPRPGAQAGLSLLLLLAFALRVYHLGSFSLWWDESLSYVRATSDLGRILANQIPIQNLITHDLHPPLYFLLLHFGTAAWGVSEFALRFLSTFANVLSIPVLYAVARQWLNPRTAWLAAALAAISPFYVYYAQEARPYALVLLWSLLALYFLRRWEQERADGLSPNLPGYVAATALALATHYLSFLLLPLHALLIATAPRRAGGEDRRRWLALVPLALCAALFVLIPVVSPDLAGPDAGGPRYVAPAVLARDLLNSFSVGVTADLAQVWWIDLGLLGLAGFGAAALLWPTNQSGRRDRRGGARAALLLLGYLLLPAAALELGSLVRPLYMNSRHLLTVSPGFILAVAVGLETLARRRTTLALALAGGALAAAAAAISLDNLYFNPAYAKDDHRAWVEYLREHVRTGDGLVLVAPQAETVLRYYAPDLLPWVSLPNLLPDQAAQERADNRAVSEAFQKWSRIWLLELHAPVADPEGHIAELMRRWGTRLDRLYFHGQSTQIVLSDFVADTPFTEQNPAIAHRRNELLGDNLEFLGYALPARATAGERGAATLYWRLKEPSGEDFGVTLAVKDRAGETWGEAGGLALGNLWSTRHWEAGVIATEQHALEVDPAAPPGSYELFLQAYHGGTGERMGGPVSLGTLEVTRSPKPLDPQKLALGGSKGVDYGSYAFAGYNLASDEVRPGDTLPLTLYFQLETNPPVQIAGLVKLAPPWLPVWSIQSAPFQVETAGRKPGDLVRVAVPIRAEAEMRPGEYDLQLEMHPTPASAWLWGGKNFATAHVTQVARAGTGVPSGARTIHARFGEGIELAAFSAARDGRRVDLTLYWRSRAPLGASYTVFTHILDAGNRVIAQQDGLPQKGERPTTSWARGETIVDHYELELPPNLPAGAYPVEVGWYEGATGARLPAFLNEQPVNGGRILLDPVTIP